VIFGRKKTVDTGKTPLNSTEYDVCLKRLLEVHTLVLSVKSDVENLKLDLTTLRRKFISRYGKEVMQQVEEKENFKEFEMPIG
jgi:hypothetical protein